MEAPVPVKPEREVFSLELSGSMARVITDRQIEETVTMFIHYLKG